MLMGLRGNQEKSVQGAGGDCMEQAYDAASAQ